MLKIKIAYLFILAELLGVPGSFVCAEEILRLAAATSAYETGLLSQIIPTFEKKYGVKLRVISAGTGKAFKLGENGDVDLVLVHARSAEDAFVASGHGEHRRDVMSNDFVLLGPENDPVGAERSADVVEAFKKINEKQGLFISRGDDSGTHKREKDLWVLADAAPAGKWYLEAGQGMSATLMMADEKNAYALIDRATYILNKDKLRLKIVFENDKRLFNPYGAIAVNPDNHPHVNYKSALFLIDWMTSPECRQLIAGYRKDGQQLFEPAETAFPEPVLIEGQAALSAGDGFVQRTSF